MFLGDDNQDSGFYTNWANWSDNQIFSGRFWAPSTVIGTCSMGEKSIGTAGRNKFIKKRF
jgi:hypothetical protein